MIEQERTALAALRFNWAPGPDDVWRPSPFHVEGLHPAVIQDLLDGLSDAKASRDSSPIGLVLKGQRGSGKTHLLGWMRQQVLDQGGYFCLLSLLDAKGFWESVLASMLDSLARPVSGSESQLRLLMRRLAAMVGAPRAARRAVMGETDLSKPALDAFIEGLMAYDRFVARESQDAARALALSISDYAAHRDIADDFFASIEESTAGERAAWGLRRSPRTAQEIVRDLSRLLALTGPTVVAVDQIDTLIAQSSRSADSAMPGAGPGVVDWQQTILLENIAAGLMALREHTRRTLTVVACLPTTWELVQSKAFDTVGDRFRQSAQLKSITDGELGREIVEKRFAVHFRQVRFVPSYPSWPVRPSAFAQATSYTPRQLLVRIDHHIRSCLLDGVARELSHLGEPPEREQPKPPTVPPLIRPEDLARFDARFEELKRDADVTTPLEPDTEDATIPGLLSAGLRAWILERGEKGEEFTQDPPPSAKPALHARLRRTLDEGTEDQVHWCFRAISDKHFAVAALNRMRRACTAAALDVGVKKRKLFLLRNEPWSGGVKTQQAVEEFERAGGETLGIDNEDLRIFTALRILLDEAPIDLQAWLIARRPTDDVAIFRRALADPDAWTSGTTQAGPRPIEPMVQAGPALTIGQSHATGEPRRIGLESLRTHVAIFAGSGSGKTVLIRRLVEECALQGVSSIVLDPNNDLARLGEAWPERPPQWGADDAGKAADYLAHTDVVVWTPRRESGRPLMFQPLPDFRGVLDDPDEFNEAVDAAVASLVPRANLNSRANKAHLGLAVLRKAIEYYGRHSGGGLKGLIDVLADLPYGVSELDGAARIAADLAQTLTAAMVNDPLLGGEGTPMDPGLLLTPAAGKRARVSVISLIGLPSDDLRQSFVNQLQMALFAWIKKHPAGDRPLLGLFVMDEAQTLAPSGAMTACTQSTLALASQARKYGLGLVFATQAPKALHNRIPGNASTQFFGLLNSPIQIEAAREMAKAKGGDVPDISRLGSGEFYLATPGSGPAKLRAPLCLSHHPRSPLTVEEVVELARRRSGA